MTWNTFFFFHKKKLNSVNWKIDETKNQWLILHKYRNYSWKLEHSTKKGNEKLSNRFVWVLYWNTFLIMAIFFAFNNIYIFMHENPFFYTCVCVHVLENYNKKNVSFQLKSFVSHVPFIFAHTCIYWVRESYTKSCILGLQVLHLSNFSTRDVTFSRKILPNLT